ncbi:MAG: hypothetical protein ACJ768_00020 [Gaiellaceae bacterium]
MIRAILIRREQGLAGDCTSKIPFKSIFRTTFAPGLLSATDVAVSALIPAVELPQFGNDGETWISVTVLVQSGRTIGFGRLLGREAKTVNAMTALVRHEATRQRVCVRNALDDPALGRDYARGFEGIQTADYALTIHGLAIGFANGVITGPSCGRIDVLVPYRLAEPLLSPLGKRLVAEVSLPR